MGKKCTAIVLAAGQGRRMNNPVAKQFLMIRQKPVIFYSLEVMQKSFLDEIILVASPEFLNYCREEIVDRYGFTKVKRIVAGGKERYHSVYEGLKAAGDCDYVFIHDGARPFLSGEILERTLQDVEKYGACVAAMPVKDTMKLADSEGFASETPKREQVWMIQTPQVFSSLLIKKAYDALLSGEEKWKREGLVVTDDAMAVEYFTDHKVKLTFGSYDNIKITTPEDLEIAELFCKRGRK